MFLNANIIHLKRKQCLKNLSEIYMRKGAKKPFKELHGARERHKVCVFTNLAGKMCKN